MFEKNIKQLNKVSISVSLGLGLVLGLGLLNSTQLNSTQLVLGLMPSSDIVLKSTVLSSSCVPNISISAPTIHFKLKPGICCKILKNMKFNSVTISVDFPVIQTADDWQRNDLMNEDGSVG